MGEKVIMAVKGDRLVELIEDETGATKVRLSSGGLWNEMFMGLTEKIIPISQISSIEFHPPGLLHAGMLRFHYPGAGENVWELNQRTVLFSKSEMEAAEAMKQEIEKRMALAQKGEKPLSALEELEKLASLRDKGVITEEEFQAKKRQLLGL